MINFKSTSQADELFYVDYEKMSVISEIMFRKFARQFNTKNGITSSAKFKHAVLPRKHTSHYGFCFLILSVVFSSAY